jgi:hypothetical protein
MHSRSIEMKAGRYLPIGQCIYCLTYDGAEAFTDEHVIAKALAGRLVFERSVCETCRRQTEGFEREALGTSLYVPRVLLGLKGRRKNKIRPLPPVSLGDVTGGGGAFDLNLSVEEYPQRLNFIVFERAGLLDGVSRSGGLKNFQTAFVRTGSGSSRTPSVTTRHQQNWSAMARTLLKNAYCFAVGELGLDAFDGDAARSILLDPAHSILNFVGFPPPEIQKAFGSQDLHRLSWRNVNDWLVVYVHLFASYGAPVYEVCVGRLLRR